MLLSCLRQYSADCVTGCGAAIRSLSEASGLDTERLHSVACGPIATRQSAELLLREMMPDAQFADKLQACLSIHEK